MKKLLIFISFLSSIYAGVVELGILGGQNFFERNDETRNQNYTRFNIYAGYQFHEISDQIGTAIRSDKFVDEIDLNYMLVLPSFRKYTPFQTIPYIKPIIGVGNTYAKNNTLTHLSYGASIGMHGKLSSKIRARFEIEYRNREWQLDRSGDDPNAEVTRFKDKELGFYVGIGWLF